MSRSTLSESSRKNARIADVDHISNLPDGVISHILSRLPIKNAVQTCLLSRYWEFKWTSIYNLHIDEDELFSDSRSKGKTLNTTFDKILLHLHNVKSFTLKCESYKPIERASWISAVLRQHNIESVELRIDYNIVDEDMVLPHSLLSCTSLRKLLVEIDGCIFRVPAKSCFLNLRSLEFSYVKILNEISSIDTITFTFPVLETLTLTDCEWSRGKCFEFLAPKMTTFKSFVSGGYIIEDGYSLKIIGSRLSEFETYGVSLENIVLTDTTVVCASIEFSDNTYAGTGISGEIGFQVRKLLREVSSSQYLELSSIVFKAIVQSKVRLSLPRFTELKELHAYSWDGYYSIIVDVEGVLEILHASPFLEVLSISVNDLNEYDYDVIESVPSCILSHLVKITFSYWSCKNPQFHLEKFLLKNALELKNVYLYCHSGLVVEEIVNQLSTFPRGSKCVTIGPET